jgi:hypothetical protein
MVGVPLQAEGGSMISEKTYEPINFTYYDPTNSFFKGKANDRAEYTVYLCNNKEDCQAYARGKCVMLGGLYGERCPYGQKRKETGPTKRAKGLYSFLSSAKERYGDVSYKLKGLRFPARIGDKVYISLPHLKNYVNPIVQIEGEHFIDAEKFTADFVIMLADFKPRALFGNEEIRSYQREEVPKFLRQIKCYFPQLFSEVISLRPDLEARAENVNFIGKYAKVKTLLPGKVKLSTNYFEWDGGELKATGKIILFGGLTDEPLAITPNENTYVEIADNATVTDDTEFKDD